MDTRGKKFYVSQFFAPWDKTNTKDSRVQMNPRTAVLASESRLKIQQLLSLTAILVIFVGLIITNSVVRKPIDIQASFDFKRSITGRITSVDTAAQSFTLLYESSADAKVKNSKVVSWIIRLIPGKSIISSKSSDRTCFFIDNLESNLKNSTPADCREVIAVSRSVLVDYVFLNIPGHWAVVRNVIGKR